MENSRKIDLVSLMVTLAIALVGLTLAYTFFNITKVSYQSVSEKKIDNLRINQILYDKIVAGIEKNSEIKPSNNDFGRTNPFEVK